MGNCGSYFRGAISPVFALGCSKIVPGSDYNLKSIRNTSFLGLIVCGVRGNWLHWSKKCRFQTLLHPRQDGSTPTLWISIRNRPRWGGRFCHGLQVLTALQFAPPLAVGGGWHADVHHVVSRGLVVGGPLGDLFLRDDAVDFCCWREETDQPFPPRVLADGITFVTTLGHNQWNEMTCWGFRGPHLSGKHPKWCSNPEVRHFTSWYFSYTKITKRKLHKFSSRTLTFSCSSISHFSLWISAAGFDQDFHTQV